MRSKGEDSKPLRPRPAAQCPEAELRGFLGRGLLPGGQQAAGQSTFRSVTAPRAVAVGLEGRSEAVSTAWGGSEGPPAASASPDATSQSSCRAWLGDGQA